MLGQQQPAPPRADGAREGEEVLLRVVPSPVLNNDDDGTQEAPEDGQAHEGGGRGRHRRGRRGCRGRAHARTAAD